MSATKPGDLFASPHHLWLLELLAEVRDVERHAIVINDHDGLTEHLTRIVAVSTRWMEEIARPAPPPPAAAKTCEHGISTKAFCMECID